MEYIVVCELSARGNSCHTLHEKEWCYSVTGIPVFRTGLALSSFARAMQSKAIAGNTPSIIAVTCSQKEALYSRSIILVMSSETKLTITELAL